MKAKNKMMAIFIVALMTVSSVAVMLTGGSDADDELERIDLDPLEIPDGFEDGMDGDAMLLGDTRATGVLEGMYPGSWTWDRTTGIGPYNSFYGAFDIDDGNRFIGVLDPYNLKQLVDGTPLSETGHYNIMWVVPTVYWSTDANGNLELSNDSTKGTAYAHTIDGHVYKYIAIGVYEGTPNDDGTSPTKLTSESGKLPIVSKTRAQFRTLAHANDVSELGTDAYAMLWNFYMWELYKYIGFTAMEDFNSQKIVGWGHTLGSTYTFDSGATDDLGPYAGKVSASVSSTTGDSSVKLILENTWGGVLEFVDGVVVNGQQGFYIDTKHSPTDATAVGADVIYVEQTLSSSGFQTSISTDSRIWGVGTDKTDGSATKGLADYLYTSSSTDQVLAVGGEASPNAYGATWMGVSYTHIANNLTYSNGSLGSRLAFVFDQDPVTFTPASYDYKLNYDPTVMTTTSAAISVDGMDPISHTYPTYTVTVASNDTSYGTVDESSLADVTWGTEIIVDGPTLTIGETTVTATPSSATEQYSYVFDGWYLNGSELESSYVVNSALTITATFEQLEPVTVTLDAGKGVISGSTELQVFVGQPIGELPTPTRKNYEFTGWYDQNGNKVTSDYIVPDADFTLTAHYELDEALQSIDKIVKILPIIIILGLLIGITVAIFYTQRYGMDIQSLIPIMIGATVGIIVFAMVLMPILNNMW